MAAATAQGTYINPMTALAGQLPHTLNGMPNPVVPPTSGKNTRLMPVSLVCCLSFSNPKN